MFHMVICDDDKNITSYIKDLIDKNYKKKMTTACVYSAGELREEIKKHKVDIVILDIALGEDDGIALAKEIGETCPDIKVILLSGYAQLASNVFDADPVYFLSKPIQVSKLYTSVDKAIEIVAHQSASVITVTQIGGRVHRVVVDEIVYMETGYRSCIIYLDDGTQIETAVKLKEVMQQMPDYFIFTHQSFACNMNKIKSFSKQEGIRMMGGQDVPVSRRHYNKVKESISLRI